jgi:hypothetical protein
MALVVAGAATIEPGTGAQPGTSNACARSLTFVKGDTVKAFASPASSAKEASAGKNVNLDIIKQLLFLYMVFRKILLR